jgi:hypothetical protein
MQKENIMDFLPVMDGQNINRDGNGVVTIKPMPILQYVMVAIIGLFAIGFLVRGDFVLGIGGIIAGVFIFLRARTSGAPLEFNPITRIFKIGTDPKSVNIPFDDMAGFGVETQKETGNFTEEKIMVMLKDGRGIQIGVITDANEKNRQEKVSRMMEFLYKTTGIVLNVNEDNELVVEKS